MFSKPKWVSAVSLYCGASAMATLAIPNHYSAIAAERNPDQYQHVLILSIDGLHGADITDPKLQSDLFNIRSLEQTGVTYTNAFTSKPSDSFPGTMAYLTGASPKTTGVYYDVSYDRQLTAPGGTAASPRGTVVPYDESIDKNPDLLSGGGDFSVGSIDLAKLPQDCTSGTCNPVYPHNYLQTNTIFDVAKAAGLHTAFSDKHPAYDLVNGPSGKAVGDLFTPEINAKVALEDGKLVDQSTAQNPASLTFNTVTNNVKTTEAYDDLKVNAILNQIKGLNSLGTIKNGVPAIFGMNFQAVSVAQKSKTGGIDVNSNGNENPSAEFTDALTHTDKSIGQILDALKQNNLFDSTLVIVLAKHGQNPRLGSATLVKDSLIPDTLKAAGIEVAQATQDDVSLLWLKDQSKASEANRLLEELKAQNKTCGGTVQQNCNPGIDKIFFGDKLEYAGFGNPLQNRRTPDLIVKLKPGFILVGNLASTVKRAEHGGLSKDDTHVALIVGSSGLPTNLRGKIQAEKVMTTQIAVTALDALGLNSDKLEGAKIENTQALPGLSINDPRKCRSERGLQVCWTPSASSWEFPLPNYRRN